MIVEARIFWGLFVFFVVVGAVYGVLSHEPAGTTALALSAGMAFIVALYLSYTARSIDPRPEDDPEAEIIDGAGELGFYSPYSWWPLAVAFSGGVTAVGVVFAHWLIALGVLMLLLSVTGLLFEYNRGEHVR